MSHILVNSRILEADCPVKYSIPVCFPFDPEKFWKQNYYTRTQDEPVIVDFYAVSVTQKICYVEGSTSTQPREMVQDDKDFH